MCRAADRIDQLEAVLGELYQRTMTGADDRDGPDDDLVGRVRTLLGRHAERGDR